MNPKKKQREPRKEFFKLSIEELRNQTEALGIEASWTMAAAAAEYRESLLIGQKLSENGAIAQEWLRDQLSYDTKNDVLTELVDVSE